MKAAWQLSERRACGLMNISISVLRYQPKADANCELHKRMVLLAGQRRRFGYRRIHVLLKREGWQINVKRVYRLYRNAGLAVRKRSRKRIGLTERVPLLLPETPNHAWSMIVPRRVSSLRWIPQSRESVWRVYWIALPGNGLYHG